jgi:hypothetical protein
MKTWEEFKRYNMSADFYGCVAPSGNWFDSSESFATAVHWCAYYANHYHLDPEQEMQWMETEGKALGFSIIHSSMLEQMYEKGLIK